MHTQSCWGNLATTVNPAQRKAVPRGGEEGLNPGGIFESLDPAVPEDLHWTIWVHNQSSLCFFLPFLLKSPRVGFLSFVPKEF